jgi:hypothetical protein
VARVKKKKNPKTTFLRKSLETFFENRNPNEGFLGIFVSKIFQGTFLRNFVLGKFFDTYPLSKDLLQGTFPKGKIPLRTFLKEFFLKDFLKESPLKEFLKEFFPKDFP